MKKTTRLTLHIFLIIIILLLASCASNNKETDKTSQNNNQENPNDETIVFGNTEWAATLGPTHIAKQILEEVGYNVDIQSLDQAVIFLSMEEKNVDFFMDAWLPYTEESLWAEYEDSLIKVATSYEDAPLGLAVPTYMEDINTIQDLEENADKFESTIVTTDPGAGLTELTREMVENGDYELGNWELKSPSEAAMIAEIEGKTDNEEPIVFTAWRPHSMFERFDLKFLEDPNEYFKFDDVYVLSYEDIVNDHPIAYDILSDWRMDIDELEEMIYKNEQEDIPFENLATEWIEDHRDQVDEMLGDYKE